MSSNIPRAAVVIRMVLPSVDLPRKACPVARVFLVIAVPVGRPISQRMVSRVLNATSLVTRGIPSLWDGSDEHEIIIAYIHYGCCVVAELHWWVD